MTEQENKRNVEVSVVISTYNRRESLRKVIESVQVQTFSQIEILVCDDGSVDGTERMVTEMSKSDERIRYINCGHNGRPAIPRNVGIREAKGEWIAFTDDDDYWNPTKLEAQLYMLKSKSRLACCSNAYCLNNGINEGKKYHRNLKLKDLSVADLLMNNSVICSTMIVSKRVLARCVGFPEGAELKAIEDYALWMRVACITPILYIPYQLIEYSMNSSDSIRQSGVQTFEMQQERVMESLYAWLDKQPEEYKRNVKVGIRRFHLNNLMDKTVGYVWNSGKSFAKKMIRKM